MFNLFKPRELASENKMTKAQVNQVIAQIHNDFYTEVDKLLEMAKIQKPVIEIDERLANKAERLNRLGFTMSKDVKDYTLAKRKVEDVNSENEEKQRLIDAINYFSEKYPNYKFITEASVNKICHKYNLYLGDVNDYIGEVPDANLEVMERFEVDKCDKGTEYMGQWPSPNPGGGYGLVSMYNTATLKICAPKSDFRKDVQYDESTRTVKQEIPDPIVLQPVKYKGFPYYLVVTAWGIESNDSEVANHKMN